MAEAAAGAGVTTIAATPHLRSDFPGVHVRELADRCAALTGAIDEAGIALRVVAAAEVSLAWALEATEEELSLASYCQNGTDLLIETPDAPVPAFDRLLYLLRVKGYRITLAHPELLRALVEQGVQLQINAPSLLGPDNGHPPKQLARRLLTDGLAQIIASDAHRASDWRPVTVLPEAVKAAAELVGSERAEWMASTAPAATVFGARLPEQPPVVQRSRRFRLFR